MNIADTKQHHLLNKIKLGKNGNFKPLSLNSIVVDAEKTTEDSYMSRYKELEMVNNHLVKLVEMRTSKLTEIIAANTKFISIIAHDLRSPFNSILSFMVLLKENIHSIDMKTIEECIDDLFNSTNGTLKLLDNLLEWGLLQNIGKTFNPVKINLLELLKEEAENHNHLLKLKQITLHHKVASGLNISADIQMTKTIFRNLINNAIKYSNNGGEITINASEYRQFVEIKVKDTGIGISNEIQRNLFRLDEFQSTAGTNNEKGTGLGLLICKEFIELHGGNIQVKSRPGIGSEFKFSLPHYI